MREAAVQSRPGHVPTAGRAGVRLRTRLVPAVALVALMGLLAGGLTVAAGAAAGTPFLSSTPGPDPPWLSGPLHGLGLALRPRGYALALVGMSVSYAVVLAWPEAVGPRRLATVIAALHLLFALAPPIVTPDVFSYLAYARVGALHHSSPYLSPPNAISGDPVVALVAFRELPSPYGPLWTLASYPLASLGLAAAVWLLKGVTAAAGLGCVALVAGIAGRLGRSPARAAALVGLNPIVLVYGVGGAHNDLLVMLLVLAGLHFGLGRREALGASVVTAAAAVKLSAGLALPFLVLGARRRWVALAAAVATAALCAAVAIATFGAASGAGLVAALRTQQRLVSEASVPWLVDTPHHVPNAMK